MGKGATLALKITGDADGGKRALDEMESRGSRFGGFMGKVGITAAAGLGVAAVGFAKLYQAADESRKIGALTEQVIKSTGGAAKISADQVGALAGAIAKKTGVDDEAIQSGANLLLTFTNVKNGIGAGNDIFNQATKIMTDMSVALGTDASGSAIQLGKALNDPVKGVTALQKVGVSFTEDQKKQIAALVKTGDTMGAQKIILNELGKEFGGAAEAASTPLDRLQQRVGDVAEKLGGFLLPIVDKGSAFLGDKLLPVVSSLADKLGATLGPAVQRAGEFLSTRLLPAVSALWQEFGPKLLPIIGQAGEFLGKLAGQVVALYEEMGPKLLPIIKSVGTVLTTFLGPALGVIFDFVSSYVVPIFRKVLGPALDGIGAAFKTVSGKIMEHKQTFLDLYESLKPFLAFIRDKVAPFVGGAFKIGFEIAGKAIGFVVDTVSWLIDKLKWILDKGAAVGRFIGGLFGAGSSRGGGAVRGAAPMRGGVRGGLFAASSPIGGGGAGPSAAAGGLGVPVGDTYYINVTGALDPVAVADQIDRLLAGRARRIGATTAFAR